MAEEEKAVVPEGAETPKKGKRSLLLILGAVVLLIGAGGYLVVRYFVSPKPAAAEDKAEARKNDAMGNVKSVMNLDAFLVNLADAESTRFVKVTFRLGLDKPKLGEEYTGDPVILAATRDKIISILSVKTADEILTPEGKDKLRSEIREKVSGILPEAKIVEVFILDFVVQL